MDPREISTRLHDILRTAQRVRQPSLGRSAEDSIESIDAVKGALRALIADLGDQEPPRLPPRIRATAAAFPEGRIPGTRTTVQHRRRTRAAGLPSRPSPRAAAEAVFAGLTDGPEPEAAAL